MSRTSTTALALLGLASLTLVPHAAHAQAKPVLTTLHAFDDAHGSGANYALTPGSDGYFYGVTEAGGINPFGGSTGLGTIYKMTPAGQFTTLWRFNGKNGQGPSGPLVQGNDGAFYGMTRSGSFIPHVGNGAGAIFRITSLGRLTILHTFTNGTDGGSPAGGLLLAPDGSFYGTTQNSGSGFGGTVFHMTADGTITTLHAFSASGDIQERPIGGLVFGSDGALYGTTSEGGNKGKGYGVIFRLTTGGAYSTLHTFNGNDGSHPSTTLAAGTDGSLYGVTFSGGIGFKGFYFGDGVVYKVTPAGLFTVLHKFSQDKHGINPTFTLAQGADGNFYGVTSEGGQNESNVNSGAGTVFVMTPAGAVTTLYKFHTAFDGSFADGVTFGPAGALYGTTDTGGAKNNGTIFKLTLPVAN